jgi:hypothetical protein
MLDNKFLFTFIGITLVVFALCKVDTSSNTTENWDGIPQLSTKRTSFMKKADGKMEALHDDINYKQMWGHRKFVHYPNYQSTIPPRYSHDDPGYNIRLNPPSRSKQAVPSTPIEMGQMACDQSKEGYCGGSVSGGDGVSDIFPSNVPSNYVAGNYEEELKNTWGKDENSPYDIAAALPVGNMSAINSFGEEVMAVHYNTLTTVNKRGNARLLSQADPIRGDIPCTPTAIISKMAVNPSVDLCTGAMNIMCGPSESTQAIADLVYTTSGNVDTTHGGVDMTTYYEQNASQFGGGETIHVTSFP